MNRIKKPNSQEIRCAIYTRKSCEEGLDQEFNSLHAQRESAEAFIASQQHEGWQCLPEMYDDGGFSGGDMERPALTRLVADIDAGKIDCVVVYKVDRLSRSLLDFSKIMSTFDEHGVSFVSVTQQFNTTHSMGRLTLNILLSFAQFEREIIGERIRDKLAAQRRRGKWTGGIPVLGYDVDRSGVSPKLVINADEARRVRRIFKLYLQLGSLLPVVESLNKRKWVNKSWTTKKGLPRGGRPFDKPAVHSLITNPIYAGKTKHKKELYDGEHESIIDSSLFQRVQTQLKQNSNGRGNHLVNKHGALLKGLLHCKACGCKMTHTFSCRGTKRYRYYKCCKAIKNGQKSCPSRSIPAKQIETLIVDQIRSVAGDAKIRADVDTQATINLTQEINDLETQSRQVEKQMKRDHAELGRLKKSDSRSDVAMSRIDALQKRITQGEQDSVSIHEDISKAHYLHSGDSHISNIVQDFDSIWEAMSTHDRCRLVSLVVERIDFDAADDGISVTLNPAVSGILIDQQGVTV